MVVGQVDDLGLVGQALHETLDRVRVRYVPDASFTAATSRTISERLQARLGPGRVQVVFEAVAAIPRGPNGKFRPVICALGPEDRARVGALAATSPSVASLSVDRQNVAAR